MAPWRARRGLSIVRSGGPRLFCARLAPRPHSGKRPVGRRRCRNPSMTWNAASSTTSSSTCAQHVPAVDPRDRSRVLHQEHEDGFRAAPVAGREGLDRARSVALPRRAAARRGDAGQTVSVPLYEAPPDTPRPGAPTSWTASWSVRTALPDAHARRPPARGRASAGRPAAGRAGRAAPAASSRATSSWSRSAARTQVRRCARAARATGARAGRAARRPVP
jgi:hypothetical protein